MARTQDKAYEAPRNIALTLLTTNVGDETHVPICPIHHEAARNIALTLLTFGSPPDKARVRTEAETAVRLLTVQGSCEIDIEALVRDLEACLHVAH